MSVKINTRLNKRASITLSKNITVGGAIFGFAGAELAADNSYIDLFHTEEVYGTASATGAVEVADYVLTFKQNGGNATAASISSLTKLDGTTALAGGEVGIRVKLSITGTPSGVETISISPAVDSVYNAAGTAMATSESESVTLQQTYETETIAYRDRVEADGGIVINLDLVDSVFVKLKAYSYLANVLTAVSPYFGVKKDASNNISKLYGLNGYDFEQLTGANQPLWEEHADGNKYIQSDGTKSMLASTTEAITNLTIIQNHKVDFTSGPRNVYSVNEGGGTNYRNFAGYDAASLSKIRSNVNDTGTFINDFTGTTGNLAKMVLRVNGTTFDSFKDTLASKLTETINGISITSAVLGIHTQDNGSFPVYHGRLKDWIVLNNAASDAFIDEMFTLL